MESALRELLLDDDDFVWLSEEDRKHVVKAATETIKERIRSCVENNRIESLCNALLARALECSATAQGGSHV